MSTIRMMCYPLLAMGVFQLCWNMVAVGFLGDSSEIGDWMYSRNCNWTIECGGARLIVVMWGTAFAVSTTIGIVRGVRAALSSTK